jgi:hypothetical protein
MLSQDLDLKPQAIYIRITKKFSRVKVKFIQTI